MMFVKCFQRADYEQVIWCEVFAVENFLRACLIEDGPILAKFDETAITQHLSDCAQSFEFDTLLARDRLFELIADHVQTIMRIVFGRAEPISDTDEMLALN